MDNAELEALLRGFGERLAHHDEQLKSAFKQITDVRTLANSVHELAKSVAILAEKQKTTTDKIDGLARDMGDLTQDVDELKARPAKAWDKAIATVLTVIITAAVTYFLTTIGL